MADATRMSRLMRPATREGQSRRIACEPIVSGPGRARLWDFSPIPMLPPHRAQCSEAPRVRSRRTALYILFHPRGRTFSCDDPARPRVDASSASTSRPP